MDTLALIFFFVGFVLIIMEVFIPGFGIAGVTGTVLIALGIIKVSSSLLMAFLLLLLLAIVVLLLFYFVYSSAAHGKLGKKLILKDSLSSSGGFTSSADLSGMVEKSGIALTTLRPSGIAEFDGSRFNVQAEGEYIKVGEKVKVLRAEGSKLTVKREE